MRHYIALIRREDFNVLLNYGQLNCNWQAVANYSCKTEELPLHPEICGKLFRGGNPFEVGHEYLMITYSKGGQDPSWEIKVKEVESVFAIDANSLSALRGRLGDNIIVKEPLWPEVVDEIEQEFYFQDRKGGVDNVWSVFGIAPAIKEKCAQVITDSVIREYVREVFFQKRPSGDLPVWNYLLMYERHDPYPKDNTGYMMDAVHVFVNFACQDEEQGMSLTDSRPIINALWNYKGKKGYNYIVQFVDGTQANFVQSTDVKAYPGYYRIALTFLNLRSLFIDNGLDVHKIVGGREFGDTLDNLKKQCGKDFYMASYLLGVVLGYNKTCSNVYELEVLPFIRKKPATPHIPISEYGSPKHGNGYIISSGINNMKGGKPFQGQNEGVLPGFAPARKKKDLKTNCDITLDTVNDYNISFPVTIKSTDPSHVKITVYSFEELVDLLKNDAKHLVYRKMRNSSKRK